MTGKLLELIESKDVLTIDQKAVVRMGTHALEQYLLQWPQIEEKLTHNFSDGVYARELFIPKGALIVGKIHKKKNMNIISKGEVTFLSVDGAFRVKAPYTFVASPGVKRIIYAHEDTVWTTIHGTHETDLEKIEEEFIAKDYSEVPEISEEELNLIKGEKND